MNYKTEFQTPLHIYAIYIFTLFFTVPVWFIGAVVGALWYMFTDGFVQAYNLMRDMEAGK